MTALALAFALVASPVFGQGGSTSATLSGVVKDKDGPVPGATVVIKNVATGETLAPVVTNETGAYSFPGLAAGPYKVTVTMQNYKTAETEVRLQAGIPANINTTLEVGKREEVVNVTASSDLVRTDTPTVSQTVNADFIQTLPRSDRNALSFLIFLPGVTTVGGSNNARNGTTIAGLANDQFNITIDGITTNSLLNNQGFFSLVTPRLDAVEEVTLTTASAGADASGQGAIQIRFVTRSGTNKYETSLYWFQQHALLNSNSYFNRLSALPVPQATNYTYGGRIGGPIILPGFDGRGRAFFFFNQEEVFSPQERARNRTIISQAALNGDYTYAIVTDAGGNVISQQTRNVLAVAAANGQVSAYDPTVQALLAAIRTAAGTTGTIQQLVTSPNTHSYDYFVPTKTLRHTPTTNVTVNLTPKNRLQGSYYWQAYTDTPDTLNSAEERFPGFPAFGDQTSYRTTGSISLRSTISTAVVNELRGGWQRSPVNFFTNANRDMFENQGFYNLSLGFGLTAPASGNANGPERLITPNYTVSDQFNWLKGSHSMQFGADYTHVINFQTDYTLVPSLSLGYQTNFDPAEGMFNTTNFPGSTSGERNNAKALYALLTGRVSSISGTGYLAEDGSQYVYNGPITQRETQDDYSFYAQDTWRWKPTVTITAGVRYQYTLPMNPASSIFTTINAEDSCGVSGIGPGVSADGSTDRFCNMFQPGYLPNPNVAPKYVLYTKENKGYHTDFNNLGPLAGVAWRPNAQGGLWRKLLGDPELATINGGYTRSFVRARLSNFQSVYNGNPGQTIPATRSTSASAFPLVGGPGDSGVWPILFSQRDRLGPPPGMDPTLHFPITATFGNGAWIFNPEIQVPWTDSWNMSFQRSLTKDTVVELRYQGNKGYKAWTFENWNANSLYETHWLTGRRGVGYAGGEYELAQANLRANVLAGRASDGFRYTGIPGTSPLPILLAHLNRSSDVNNPAAYTGGVWSSTTFTGSLDPYFPNPSSFASNLYLSSFSTVDTTRNFATQRLFNNALAMGYPVNFWQMNPGANAVEVETNSAAHPMNHLVTLQVRRRLAAGLAAQASYTWQRNISQQRLSFQLPLLNIESDGVPHAIQTLWTYEIPFGRGKKYGANIGSWLDAAAGGWTFSGTARFQRQSFHVRDAVLVGMDLAEAQAALSTIRFVTDPVTGAITVFSFPQDIYDNTRLAFDTDETQPTFYVPGREPNGPVATPTADGRYRYFAPAGGLQADGTLCNFIYTGDCGTQTLYFLGRWFGEMDFRLAKQFQLPGRARFEFSAEIFNATKALNFPVQSNDGNNTNNGVVPGTSSSTFRTRQTQSSARTAQLVWRVSW